MRRRLNPLAGPSWNGKKLEILEGAGCHHHRIISITITIKSVHNVPLSPLRIHLYQSSRPLSTHSPLQSPKQLIHNCINFTAKLHISRDVVDSFAVPNTPNVFGKLPWSHKSGWCRNRSTFDCDIILSCFITKRSWWRRRWLRNRRSQHWTSLWQSWSRQWTEHIGYAFESILMDSNLWKKLTCSPRLHILSEVKNALIAWWSWIHNWSYAKAQLAPNVSVEV